MTKPRNKSILLKVTEAERDEIAARAKQAGTSSNAYIRRRLELSVPSEAREVERAAPAVKAQPVQREVAPDLAERRERRAKQLSAKMPLTNAKQVAAREIAE